MSGEEGFEVYEGEGEVRGGDVEDLGGYWEGAEVDWVGEGWWHCGLFLFLCGHLLSTTAVKVFVVGKYTGGRCVC